MADNYNYGISFSILSEVDEESKQRAFNVIKDYAQRNKINLDFDFNTGNVDAFFKSFGNNLKIITNNFRDSAGIMQKEIQSISASVNNGLGNVVNLNYKNNGGDKAVVTATETVRSLTEVFESYQRIQNKIMEVEGQLSSGKAKSPLLSKRDLDGLERNAKREQDIIKNSNLNGANDIRQSKVIFDDAIYDQRKNNVEQEYLNLLNKESAQKAQLKSLESDTSRITENEVAFMKKKLELTEQQRVAKVDEIYNTYGNSNMVNDATGILGSANQKHAEGQKYYNAVSMDADKTAGLEKIANLKKIIYEYDAMLLKAGKNKDVSEKIKDETDKINKKIEAVKKLHDIEDKDINNFTNKSSKTDEETQKQIKLQMETNKTGGLINRMTSQFGSVFARMVDYTAVFSLLSALGNAGRSAISTTFELNKAMTDIRMVTNMSKESVTALTMEYSQLGRTLGATTAEVMASASEWLRQGKTIAETNGLIKSTMILSKIGVMDSKDATEKLTSTLNGFNLEAKDSMAIIDGIAKVDMLAATSSNELMTAFQRSAASAQEAGVNWQELTGYIASVSETTRRSASTIGESFDFRRYVV